MNLISWWGTNSAEGVNYFSPVLYFNLKSFKDNNFSWFSRSQVILHDSGVVFSNFSNFNKLKRAGGGGGGADFFGGTNSAEGQSFLFPRSAFQF